MKKVGIVLLAVAVAITIPLFAADVTWYWSSDNQSIDLYRYKIDVQGEDWTIIENNITSATFFDLSEDEDVTFTLQYSEDNGKSWSESINANLSDASVSGDVRIIWDIISPLNGSPMKNINNRAIPNETIIPTCECESLT